MSTVPLWSFRTCSATLIFIASENTSVVIVEAILQANSERDASVVIVRNVGRISTLFDLVVGIISCSSRGHHTDVSRATHGLPMDCPWGQPLDKSSAYFAPACSWRCVPFRFFFIGVTTIWPVRFKQQTKGRSDEYPTHRLGNKRVCVRRGRHVRALVRVVASVTRCLRIESDDRGATTIWQFNNSIRPGNTLSAMHLTRCILLVAKEYNRFCFEIFT